MDRNRLREVVREDRRDNISVGALFAVLALFAGAYAFLQIEDPIGFALTLVISGIAAALGCSLLISGARG